MSTVYEKCSRCYRIAATCPHRHPELPNDGTECPHGIKRPERVRTEPPSEAPAKVPMVENQSRAETSREVDIVLTSSELEQIRELNNRLQRLLGKGLSCAKEWLRILLENGRMPAVDIYGIAAMEVDATGKRRFSERTLNTAKKELGVKTRRYGCGKGSVYWELQ